MPNSVQTTYSRSMTAYFAGLIADIRDMVVESYSAEVAMPFGYVAIAGTATTGTAFGTFAGGQVKLPTTTGGVVRGLVAAEQAQQQGYQTGTVAYAVGDQVNVVRRGMIWCVTAGSVTADAAAYFEVTTGKVASSGDNIPSAVFRTSTTTAGIALVEINLPTTDIGS